MCVLRTSPWWTSNRTFLLLAINLCYCATAAAFTPTWLPAFKSGPWGGAVKVCSGAGVNLGMAIPHNQDGEGRTSAISDGEDFESMSRRAILNKIAVAGLLLAGLSWQEEAHAEVGAVSWPIAASGRVDYKQRIAIEKVPESSPIQTLLPDNGVAVITGSNTGEEGVRANVRALVEGDPKLAASLLRLAFHDATARDTESGEGGANGSILYELERRENYGLGLAIKALQPIKLTCGLGWADTIAVAGSAAVEAAGGPHIPVKLGRKDARIADPLRLRKPVGKCEEPTVKGGGRSCRGVADSTIPSAGLDSDGIRNFFGRLGFDDAELVALMGAHTIGRWTSLLGMRKACLKDLNAKWAECLPEGKRLPFVTEDPDRFSNTYFKWLLRWNKREIESGDVHFIPTDVVLVVDDKFKSHVQRFANDQQLFFQTFARAYNRLVSLGFSA